MSSKYYSFKQIVESLPKKKNSLSSIWVKMVVRRVSFVFTYLFVNLRITPWQASVLSAIVALLGAFLITLGGNATRVAGIICIQMWLVLDCVDGNIARVTHKCSEMGDFIDTLSGYVISAFAMLGIGIYAQQTTHFAYFQDNNALIILGALGAIGNVLARLIHQNYMVTILRLQQNGKIVDNPDNQVVRSSGFGYVRSRIDKEIGISGLFMPFLILAAIFGWLDIFTVFYSLFFGASAIIISVYYAYKSNI
ncbi:MAG: CDP-alcohol phosphatidyltransferase family protein [Oscillospiraceae bacterium]|nr:CDP-alcohol phosphatidyltransferase family protein [Oscillospiraceae bacterium]